ncbi:hypothetical protein vseg_003468 [Gypsophila vaccaria]
MSVEDMLQSLTMNGTSMQQVMTHDRAEIKASISNIEQRMGQMASAISRLEAKGKWKFPATTIPNPNVSAITLWGGKDLRKAQVSKQSEKKVEGPIIAAKEKGTGEG